MFGLNKIFSSNDEASEAEVSFLNIIKEELYSLKNDSIIVINFDSFINYKNNTSPDFYNKFIDQLSSIDEAHNILGATHGYLMFNLQQSLYKRLETNEKDIFFLNFENQALVFDKNSNDIFNGICVNSLSNLDAKVAFNKTINIFALSKIIKKHFPNLNVNINFSLSMYELTKSEARRIMETSLHGVKINCAGSNTEIDLNSSIIYNLMVDLYPNINKFSISNAIEIHHKADMILVELSSYYLNSKETFNIQNIEYSKDDLSKKIKDYDDGKLSYAYCSEIHQNCIEVFNKCSKLLMSNNIQNTHKLPLRLIEEYLNLSDDKKNIVKNNLAVVQSVDIKDRGIEINPKYRDSTKRENKEKINTSIALSSMIIDKIKSNSSFTNNNIENIFNFFYNSSIDSSPDLFFGKHNMPYLYKGNSYIDYNDFSLFKQIPHDLDFMLNLDNIQSHGSSATSESTAIYTIINSFNTFKLRS